MISILFEINEIDAGKWFQIVMTGLTLEILFILVSVMSKRKKPRYEASPVTPVQSEAESEAEESVGASSTVYDGAVGPNPPPPPPLLSLKVKSQMVAPPLCMKIKSQMAALPLCMKVKRQMAATPPPASLNTLVSKIMV